MARESESKFEQIIAKANEAAQPAIAYFDAQVTQKLVAAGVIALPDATRNTRIPVNQFNTNYEVELQTYHKGARGIINCPSNTDTRHLIVRRLFSNGEAPGESFEGIPFVTLEVFPLRSTELVIQVSAAIERASSIDPGNHYPYHQDYDYGYNGIKQVAGTSGSLPPGVTVEELLASGYQRPSDLPAAIDHDATIAAIVDRVVAGCLGPLPLVVPPQT